MNKLKKTLRRGTRRVFCGKSVSETSNQQVSNTSPSASPKLNVLSRLVVREGKETKTRRNLKMNNMKQVFMKRMRRIIGVGRSLVFNSVKEEREFGDQTVDREFGERQTEFTVPQTGDELRTAKRRRSVCAKESSVVGWIDGHSAKQTSRFRLLWRLFLTTLCAPGRRVDLEWWLSTERLKQSLFFCEPAEVE